MLPRLTENSLTAHQKRAIAIRLDGADFLVKLVGEDFAERIGATNRTFANCADIFSLSNKVSEIVGQQDNVQNMQRFERPQIADALNKFDDSLLVKQFDEFSSTTDNDLVVCAFGLHWTKDVQSVLQGVLASMKADGLFLAAMPMHGTLMELQDSLMRAELELTQGAAMRVDRFVEIQQAGSILQQAGFALPVVDKQEFVVRYDDMFALIRDLRAMGATSALLENVRPHRNLFVRANELYLENHRDEDGRVRASFNIAYLTAWSPHASQQKPLKPGSASVLLADHLKSVSKN